MLFPRDLEFFHGLLVAVVSVNCHNWLILDDVLFLRDLVVNALAFLFKL